MFAPYIFPPKHFCFPVFFSSPEWHFTRKKVSKNFAGKISSPKTLLLQGLFPKIYSQENFLKKKNCSPFSSPNVHPKNLLPKYFLPRICCQTFLLSIFLLTMKFYLQKFLQNIFAGEISSSQESLLQNFLPRKFLPKKIVLHFAPLIFIQKNLLPKFFLPRICCQTFLLSIFLLTMKFYLLAKFPPHKNLSSKTWSPKFPPKKICFKKKLFPILHPPPPPPPPKKKSFKIICSPNISSQTFLLSILLLTKNCFPNFAPQKSLLPKPLCGAVMSPD